MTGCIDHGSSPGKDTYATRTRRGKTRSAHAWVLIDKTGELPDGRVAMHSCDNKRCINEDHLSWGTYTQNRKDVFVRGLATRQLTDTQADDIRNSEARITDLAKRYNVNPGTIHGIRNGKLYL